jgi:HEAT repeat protein
VPLIRKPSREAAAPPPAGLDKLLNGTDDERWEAARSASTVADSPALIDRALAQERNPRVREAMFTSLALLGTPPAIEVAIRYLRSDDAHVRTEALDALRAMKAAPGPYLSALLGDADGDVRILACEIARSLPGREASALLAGLVERESDANVCAAAVEVLAEIGTADTIPSLEACEARFQSTPFLVFSIRTAVDRIRSHARERG